jgi:uncharacterized membrane protein
MEYLILKWVHILSATILFGTGLGSAFYMFMANRSKDVASISFATRHVVIADWLFTTPAVIVQLISGLWLVRITSYGFSDLWVLWALGLYLFAGLCWLPVVVMQFRMRDLARRAQQHETPLPAHFWHLNRWWIFLGALAFPAILVVFYLMVFRPT